MAEKLPLSVSFDQRMTAQTVTVVQLVTTHRSALLIIRECQSPGSAQSIYLHRQVHPDIFGQIPF